MTDITYVSEPTVNYNYHCGDDLAVVNAARRSFNKKSDWDWVQDPDSKWSNSYCLHLKPKDKNLIEFLARGMSSEDFDKYVDNLHLFLTDDEERMILKQQLWTWRHTPTHDTPFNHCFVSFDVEAPIYVRAHLVKSEYLIMSEFSRRYITDDIRIFRPKVWRGAAENKKQGSHGIVELDYHTKNSVESAVVSAVHAYNLLLSKGVAPEQARGKLPQEMMTAWTWSGTLGAFAKMCQLRLSSEAQQETRDVARLVRDKLYELFPVSAPALIEGVH
jgi:thymidylate synthase (FAD)